MTYFTDLGLTPLTGDITVEMVINDNVIKMQIDGLDAPVTAANFVDIVERGIYNATKFHRLEPGFVAQGGDPQSKDSTVSEELLGTGGFIDPATDLERNIPLEIKPVGADEPIYSKTFAEAEITAEPFLPHSKGAIAMARSKEPDTASSQFYFALDDLSQLDGSYAVFGAVTEGMNVVENIAKGDAIQYVAVTGGSVASRQSALVTDFELLNSFINDTNTTKIEYTLAMATQGEIEDDSTNVENLDNSIDQNNTTIATETEPTDKDPNNELTTITTNATEATEATVAGEAEAIGTETELTVEDPNNELTTIATEETEATVEDTNNKLANIATETEPTDEPVADETGADETGADETGADETVADETVADETVADETVADETVADETGADETVADEPVADEPGDGTIIADANIDETGTDDTADPALRSATNPEEITTNENQDQGIDDASITAQLSPEDQAFVNTLLGKTSADQQIDNSETREASTLDAIDTTNEPITTRTAAIMALGGNDQIQGTNNNDVINGNSGDDEILGAGGHDFLRGGKGNDKVSGGIGNDFLVGDYGVDTLTGNEGIDNFILRASTEQGVTSQDLADVIADFSVTDGDRISVIADFITKTDLVYEASGNDTILKLGTTGDILALVKGVTQSIIEQNISIIGTDDIALTRIG